MVRGGNQIITEPDLSVYEEWARELVSYRQLLQEAVCSALRWRAAARREVRAAARAGGTVWIAEACQAVEEAQRAVTHHREARDRLLPGIARDLAACWRTGVRVP